MISIPLSKPTIGVEEGFALNNALASGWLAAGPETEAFEQEFATYVGVKYAIFTNSCTSALKMAYKWFVEQKYAYMYYPENTYCATYSAAVEVGMPMYPYSSHTGWSIGNEPHAPVRVNVHYGGIKDEVPCGIEDSAHRIEPNDPLVGKIRCYSFGPAKNMTTGSGGMIVTNEKDIYETLRLYWRDGLSSTTAERALGAYQYTVQVAAGGYDGNDLAAALGRAQLKKLPGFTTRRNQIRDQYNAAFSRDWKGNHLYPYFVDTPEQIGELIDFLKEKGIGTGYHYPNTGWLGVSLPIYPLLTDWELAYIIQHLKEWREKPRPSSVHQRSQKSSL